MKRIVILFSGEGTNLVNLIEKLQKAPVSIAAAICNRPEAKGISRAKKRGVSVDIIDHRLFNSREEFDTALVSKIEEYTPDLVVMAGFMRILTPVFTDRVKAINLHPSMLPKFKGAKAIERSFQSSDKYGGVSVHWVSSELDGGEVIAQHSFEKESGETLESFTKKIHEIEYELLPETVKQLCEA